MFENWMHITEAERKNDSKQCLRLVLLTNFVKFVHHFESTLSRKWICAYRVQVSF